MTTLQKVATYLKAISQATDLEAAQRDARLALVVIEKGVGK